MGDLFPSRTLTLYLARMFVTRILGAVSYTHLDVYKRQVRCSMAVGSRAASPGASYRMIAMAKAPTANTAPRKPAARKVAAPVVENVAPPADETIAPAPVATQPASPEPAPTETATTPQPTGTPSKAPADRFAQLFKETSLSLIHI